MDSIEEAENLVENDIEKALSLYKKICFDMSISESVRLIALLSILKKIPDEGLDILSRLRDSLQFLRGAIQENQVKLLIKLSLPYVFLITHLSNIVIYVFQRLL
jgi:hypothetical protein